MCDADGGCCDCFAANPDEANGITGRDVAVRPGTSGARTASGEKLAAHLVHCQRDQSG